jgi:hypothetical protein
VELTICLITKGRFEYLEELLNSLEGVSEYDWVKILIILNGAEQKVVSRINEWASTRSEVSIESREVNEVRPTTWWPLLKAHTDGWCIFISDDDVFNVDVLAHFQRKMEEEPNLVAVTALAEVIDSKGYATGEIKKSFLHESTIHIEAVAKSLNAPPFPWPTLFFNISKLPEEIPNSRYVFDWWVCVQLVLNGEIGFLEEICVQYRNHPQQESHLASNRRKYFEAFVWFEQMIQGVSFQKWLSSLSEEEILDFWKFSLVSLPIYGDSQYSTMLLGSLRSELAKYISLIQRSKILGDFAFLNGVPLKDEDLGSLLSIEFNQIPTHSNIEIEILPKTCKTLSCAEEFFSLGNGRNFLIGCKHSTSKSSKSVLVDCAMLTGDSPQITADLILIEITKHLEKSGAVSLAITPKEKTLVLSLRRVRKLAPNSVLNLARKLLN